MEGHIEQEPRFKIELPAVGDEKALAPVHIQAWKEAYIVPESGLTEEKIDELLAHLLTDTTYRRGTIERALAEPEVVLYRVVKNVEGNIVGFLHGSKYEDYTELDAIYLLNEAKDSGTGSKLMGEFLSWSDRDKPCRLEVFSFNETAISFYNKFGFEITKSLPLYKNILPVSEMVRPVQEHHS